MSAQASDFHGAVDRSLIRARQRIGREAMPASPYRRLDAGAVGSIVAGYPLQLFPPRDPRLLDTVEFLLERCMMGGAFFQDMTHSGVNAYLTLQLAQVLLRAEDPRHRELMAAVAALASPTGQWPEAIHPRTGGGCMGDGQHVWAAAEWVIAVRNCLLREEGDRLVLGSGVPAGWLEAGGAVSIGPAPTQFGPVTAVLEPSERGRSGTVRWNGDWHGAPPPVEIRVPGFEPVVAGGQQGAVELRRAGDSAA